MADAIIDRLSPSDIGTLVHLYNNVFRPERNEDWLRARIDGRKNVLIQVARIDRDAVGFYVGFELKPKVHFSWMCGVVPDLRRAGIGGQLMDAAADWTRTEGYRVIRFECTNQIRPFLHFGISHDFDIVGIRWDHALMTNLIVFERVINPTADTL